MVSRRSDLQAREAATHQATPRARLQESLRALSFEIAAAEQRERERIARGLHDDLGQLLAVAHFKVRALYHSLPATCSAELDELSTLLSQASQAARTATFDLNCPALQLGLDEALLELSQKLSRTGATVFCVDGHVPPMGWPQPVLAVLYRVLRELALNVQRHARAQRAWFRIGHDQGRLVVSVADDGIGITREDLDRGHRPDGGYGLVSARAQMLALGGDLVVESGPGAGTVATLTLPLQQIDA